MPPGRTVTRACCALAVVTAMGSAALGTAHAVEAPPSAPGVELRALSVAPSVVTVATAPATVAVAAHVLAPNGTDAVRVTFGRASAPLQLTAGHVLDGMWSGVVTLPASTSYGALDAYVAVTDRTGATTATATAGALTVTDAVPAAPARAVATGTPGTVRVEWAPPASNGTSPVTAYDVTLALPGAAPLRATLTDAATTAVTFGDLADGRYVARVAARNAAGTGPATVADTTTELGTTVPDAPAAVVATPGDGTLRVAWSAPPSDGRSPVVGYDVTATPRADAPLATATAEGMAADLTGLRNGVTYDVTVVARNSAGAGLAATATAAPRTVPAALQITSVASRDRAVVVRWAAPAGDGGAPVESYAVTAQPSGIVVTVPATARETRVGRLPNGIRATFTVTAVNAAGSGAPSAPRAATPLLPARLDVVTQPATPIGYRTETVVTASLTAATVGVPGERVELLAQVRPSTTWRVVAAGTTGGTGRVTLRATLPATSALKLRHPATTVAASEVAVRSVAVAVKVNALPSASRLRLNQTLTVRGAVAPAHPTGSRVHLQRYSDGAWRTVASGRMTTTTAYRVTWRATRLGSALMRVVKPGDGDHLRGYSPRWTQRVDPENAADHARAILADGSIRLERVHVSGVSDLAHARQNVVDVAAGRLARRSSYENAPGGYAALDPRLLRALRRMGAAGSVTVSEIAGGSHAPRSEHYYGRGLDISYVNGRHVGPGSGYGMAVEACRAFGAVRVFSPSYDPYGGHQNHVHCEW